jgi:palmitoyl-protein thioesterase
MYSVVKTSIDIFLDYIASCGSTSQSQTMLTIVSIQIDRLCEELAKDEILQSFPGINLIGFSQGGMIARGFLERCNDPPVINFISWVSPQGGQFGVPGFINSTIERIIDDLVECCAYDRWLQEILSVAGYWRGSKIQAVEIRSSFADASCVSLDPYQEAAFVNGSIFLADVDNLRPKKNHLYKQRFARPINSWFC